MTTTRAAIHPGPFVSSTRPIPLAEIAPWAVFAAVVALILLYFVSTEQGAFALFDGKSVHEYVHDGRHLLGFPCH
ncbi:Probable cobalt transporter subunit (CbtB) [Sphingomonas gellani]|uniref:Probable cobalt transporter subunit (CbtB) n=1 Tax=Sphingomonas gellani TaxID=1166340 RepID=A0A1H8CS45_9SPHN|nr:CbtB-domain containing protein [Sphingomonas gellani]SEM97800.1 Probable cobalt transporter subunit (CbtB) [Sphingomonas gellani]